MKKFSAIFFSMAFFIAISFSSEKVSAEVSENFAQEILYLVNVERKNAGLKPVALSKDLMHAAKIRANEITKKFSHTRPNGSSFYTTVRTAYRYVGENIAAGQLSSEEVVQSWMDSPGHRENILDPHYTRMGVGYVYNSDTVYKHFWTQLFKG